MWADLLKLTIQALSMVAISDNMISKTPDDVSMDSYDPPDDGGLLEKSPDPSEFDRLRHRLIVQFPPDYCKNTTGDEEWDFVVIGAGAGGTVAARRLAENPKYKVLLLEAGEDPPPKAFIPGQAASVMATSTWRFNTVPTGHVCQGIVFGSCVYNPGKCLGGGSVVYYMMYIRGNRQDYDEWEAWGNPGWGYKDVLPYLKKFENYNASNYDPKYHGKGGPVLISDWNVDPFSQPIREGMFGAAEELGLKRNYDNNGKTQIGPVSLVAAVDPLGYRVTVADAYLQNIPDNLKVCKSAFVSKVNLSKGKRARSVNFLYEDHIKMKVKAKKEIIVSAGALMTPGILERSGIGKRDVLESANVAIKLELPGVGEHLEDHFVNMGCAFALKMKNKKPVNPMTLGLSTFTLFLNTSNIEDPVPSSQYLLFIHEDVLAIGLNFKPNIAAQLSALSNSTSTLLYFASAVVRPKNRGFVHIWDSDAKSKPVVVSNHLRNRYEIEETVRAVRFARKMFLETKSMKPFEPMAFQMKECAQYEFNSEEEIICGAQHLANSVNHMSGTARMGPDHDPFAVVDSQLRVRGIKGLRVADASIFPDITRGNTWATTLMVGEKAADMIKATYDPSFK